MRNRQRSDQGGGLCLRVVVRMGMCRLPNWPHSDTARSLDAKVPCLDSKADRQTRHLPNQPDDIYP